MKALSPEQIERILKVAYANKRNHAMILLAYKVLHFSEDTLWQVVCLTPYKFWN